MNISCAFPNCTNSVIGQCSGYKEQCGRFYCADHSNGILCFQCAGRKNREEEAVVAQEQNRQIIKRVERQGFRAAWHKNIFIIGTICLLILIVGIVLSESIRNTFLQHESQLWNSVPYIIGFWSSIIGLVGMIFVFFVYLIRRGIYIRSEIRKFDSSSPGIFAFYEKQEKDRQKNILKGTLTIFGVILIGMLAAASQSKRDRDD